MPRNLIMVTALVAAACGGGSAGPPDAAGSPDASPDAAPADAAPPDACAGPDPTLDQALACMRVAHCELLARCEEPFDMDLCVEESGLLGPSNGHQPPLLELLLREAIADGRVTFHPDRVAPFLAASRAWNCAEEVTYPAPLYDTHLVFTGPLADGDECILDFECQSGQCYQPPPCAAGDACCTNTCTPRAALGEPCGEAPDLGPLCGAGDHCARFGDEFRCVTGDAGEPCGSHFECDIDLYCDYETGQCEREVAPGASCTQNAQCPGDQTCIGDLGDEVGTCGRSDREGDACDDGCFGFYCLRATPDELGTCVPYLQEEGADCSEVRCAQFDFECDPDTDRCVPRGDVGDPCGGSELRCRLFLVCGYETIDDPDPVCIGRLAEGERCLPEGHCESGICGGDPEAPTCQPYPGCYSPD